MPSYLIIPILVGVGILSAVAAFFTFANSRGTKRRGARRVAEEARGGNGAAQQRKTDVRAFTGPEKRLYGQAKKLLAEGKVQAAARIYEQLNMQREAIQALEDAGMIHEAAKILMRMGKANRAGVVYARHGLWMDAAAAFKMAQMPLEVAKCAREAGQYALAGEYFEKSSRYEDAGECFEKVGDLHRAARFFQAAGVRDKAMKLYDQFASAGNAAIDRLSDDEVRAIVEHLTEGNLEVGLSAVVVRKIGVKELVGQLVAKGLSSQAKELYLRASDDIGPDLMADVNYQDKSAELLAQLFLSVEQWSYAGMVFERMASFERAGAAFEAAKDFERAAYCFERAGLDERARPLKEKARRGEAPQKNVKTVNAGFALSTLPQDTAERPVAFGEATSDATAVFDANGEPAPAPAPVVVAPRPPAFVPPKAAPSFSLSSEDDVSDALPPAPVPTPAVQAQAALPETHAPLRLVVPEAPPQARAPVAPSQDPGHASFHRAKFLSDLDFDQKNALWAIGETCAYDEGEVVLTYDDEPKGVYIITSGTVACYRNVGGKETYVDQMGASETFGELWLLADQPTAVRFVAQTASHIRVIERDAFNELMDRDGTLARKVYKRFTLRLLKRLLKPQSPSANKAAS